ncbi:hypothetical protein AB0M54_24285 [Actinoplanes sp. NPDC051470]|uniref:hypothetical protein n=1 Tax=Actinoplanes sp. NPDC051470 TaxID=3157224 RepID=UPI0034203D64
MAGSVQVGADVLAADINQLLLKPIVRLIAQATQSLANATGTAMTFGAGSEDIDTHNFHDVAVNSTRITPSAGWAGYYRVGGAVMHGSRNDYSDFNAWIRKTAAINMPAAHRGGYRYTPGSGSLNASVFAARTEVIVALDPASGDYIELMGQQSNAAAAAQLTNQSSQYSTVLELEFLRPLT